MLNRKTYCVDNKEPNYCVSWKIGNNLKEQRSTLMHPVILQSYEDEFDLTEVVTTRTNIFKCNLHSFLYKQKWDILESMNYFLYWAYKIQKCRFLCIKSGESYKEPKIWARLDCASDSWFIIFQDNRHLVTTLFYALLGAKKSNLLGGRPSIGFYPNTIECANLLAGYLSHQTFLLLQEK